MNNIDSLAHMVLAPYIMKATALISKERKVGGNQFRHQMGTLAILLDYKYFNNPVLLKASVIHDLKEEIPDTSMDEIRAIDNDGPRVAALVLEITKNREEPKDIYLKRILEKGSWEAKILKVADRIDNVTDLNRDVFIDQKIEDYLNQTELFVVPMAELVDKNMVIELTDMIKKRRGYIGCNPENDVKK